MSQELIEKNSKTYSYFYSYEYFANVCDQHYHR